MFAVELWLWKRILNSKLYFYLVLVHCDCVVAFLDATFLSGKIFLGNTCTCGVCLSCEWYLFYYFISVVKTKKLKTIASSSFEKLKSSFQSQSLLSHSKQKILEDSKKLDPR